MNCKHLAAILFLCLALLAGTAHAAIDQPELSVQLIRNATVKITYGDTTFLIDPMLADQGTYPGFPETYRSELYNPLIPLPMSKEEILKGVDAVILTHTHLDHWDKAAQKALDKNILFYAQDETDAALLRSQGFKNVRIIDKSATFGEVTLTKTACRHGSERMYSDPETAKQLGSVMGIAFTAPGEKTIYLAADTVWFSGVEEAISIHKPDIIILNTGAAALTAEEFKADPYIIMGKEDTLRATKAAPNAKIVAVHMDAINHMTNDRKDLSEFAYEKGIRDKVMIPFDGETLHF